MVAWQAAQQLRHQKSPSEWAWMILIVPNFIFSYKQESYHCHTQYE